jgi:hypothetical protein
MRVTSTAAVLVGQIAAIDWTSEPLLARCRRDLFAIFFVQVAQTASQRAVEQKMLEKIFDNGRSAAVEQVAVFASAVAVGRTTRRRQAFEPVAGMAASQRLLLLVELNLSKLLNQVGDCLALGSDWSPNSRLTLS